MKLNESLKFEKENMPSFQWKFEKFMFVFLAVLIGGALITLVVSLILGFLIGDNGVIYLIPLFVWVGAVAGMSIALIVVATRVKGKLRVYHAEKLQKEFFKIDGEEAEKRLIANKRITENEFILDEKSDFAGEYETLPFERAQVEFIPHFYGGRLLLNLAIRDEADWLLVDVMDNDYCNFLSDHIGLVKNKKLFKLFCTDKAEFARLMVRYNDAAKIEKLLP